MIRLIGVAISIGLADSLNPSTIAPALFLASGDHARRKVTEFTVGVFLVYLAGGTIIALGPGQLVRSLLPHPHHRVAYILELVVGAAMIVLGLMLMRNREKLTRRRLPQPTAEGKSSAWLGATITAVELPTAFPYFAVVAAVVGSGLGPVRQFLLLVIFNVCFVLPLIGIVLTLAFAGEHAEQLLTRGRDFLQQHWPALLAGLALTAGAIVAALGATGLAGGSPGDLGELARRLHHRLMHPLK